MYFLFFAVNGTCSYICLGQVLYLSESTGLFLRLMTKTLFVLVVTCISQLLFNACFLRDTIYKI